MKCDIEGGEYELFNSLSLETLSKIDKIAIETHDIIQNETFFIPIPKELIKKLKWTEDTDIGISVKDNTLILTKQLK